MPESLYPISPEIPVLPTTTEHAEALEPEPTTTPISSAALAVAEAVNVDLTPQHPEKLSLRDHFYRSRLGRLALTGLAALGLAGGMAVLDAAPAFADSGPVYTVVNPDHDGTRSIYDRNSPSWADSTRKAPDFSYYGDRLQLICGTNGEAVGPYNNRRWHYANNLSRPEAGVTWIPDRYLNTPNKANQRTPGERECGSNGAAPNLGNKTTSPQAQVKACYFNLKAPSKNLTFSYGGDHRYLGNAWQAAENWTEAGAGITINQTSESNAYVKFKDVYVTGPTVIEGVKINSGTLAATVIPESWQEQYSTTVPKNPHHPASITILVNQYAMDSISGDAKKRDFFRTYTLTHEAGHALGLAHPDQFCNQHPSASIMQRGNENLFDKNYNTPMPFDRAELRQLYS